MTDTPVEERTLRVQGSADYPYTVRFRRRGAHLQATCDCKAGIMGAQCKHRILPLAGKPLPGLIEGDPSGLDTWLQGTDLALAVDQLTDLERQAARLKAEITRAKTAVGRAMNAPLPGD